MSASFSMETVNSLRHAAAATALDAYDRNVDREYFCQVLDIVLNFIQTARQFELAYALHKEGTDKKLTLAMIEDAKNKCQTVADGLRQQLTQIVHTLSNMPNTNDTIH